MVIGFGEAEPRLPAGDRHKVGSGFDSEGGDAMRLSSSSELISVDGDSVMEKQ